MTVYGVFGERYGDPYEDPGAEELVSLHMSEEGADTGRAMHAADVGTRYDAYSVVELEVFP